MLQCTKIIPKFRGLRQPFSYAQGFPWVGTSDRAQWEWCSSAPWCLRLQLEMTQKWRGWFILRCLHYQDWVSRAQVDEGLELGWGCGPEHLHLASPCGRRFLSASRLQSSWTYMLPPGSKSQAVSPRTGYVISATFCWLEVRSKAQGRGHTVAPVRKSIKRICSFLHLFFLIMTLVFSD